MACPVNSAAVAKLWPGTGFPDSQSGASAAASSSILCESPVGLPALGRLGSGGLRLDLDPWLWKI